MQFLSIRQADQGARHWRVELDRHDLAAALLIIAAAAPAFTAWVGSTLFGATLAERSLWVSERRQLARALFIVLATS